MAKLTIFRYVFAAFFTIFLGPQTFAADTQMEQLDSWGRNRGWEGVGLLNIAEQATCTGTLIRPDIVLTAAHCLIDNDTGERFEPHNIEFRAGWRNDQAIAKRRGKYSVVHANFISGDGPELNQNQIRHDVGLLQLESPIYSSHADPFKTDGGIRKGTQVSVVSYGQGRNDAASRQRSCEILERFRYVAALSCDVVPGSSGAPVFAQRDGHPRIISIISAAGHMSGRPVAFAMDIEKPLADVLSNLASGRGVYPKSVAQSAKRITVGTGQRSTGARFIRP